MASHSRTARPSSASACTSPSAAETWCRLQRSSMSRATRWAFALVTIGLAAGAGYRFVYLPITQEEPASEPVDASVVDAGIDARAPVAKGKPAKKPAVRGGKTRITGKVGGSKPVPAPAAPIAHGPRSTPAGGPGHAPHEKHDRHEKP